MSTMPESTVDSSSGVEDDSKPIKLAGELEQLYESDTESERQDQGRDHAPSLARIDKKKVLCLRGIMLSVLLLATSAMALSIFKITRAAEKEQFETNFRDHTTRIFDTLTSQLKQMIGAIDNVSVGITSQGQMSGESWPFIVIPQFEIRGASSRALSGSDFLGFVPLVTNDTRTEWESFVLDHTSWIEAGLKREKDVFIERQHTHDHRRILRKESIRQSLEIDSTTVPADFSNGIASTIYRISEGTNEAIVDDTSGPYFPIWQTTPVHATLVNYNLMSHETIRKTLDVARLSEDIVFGPVADLSDAYDPFHFLHHEVNGGKYRYLGDIQSVGNSYHKKDAQGNAYLHGKHRDEFHNFETSSNRNADLKVQRMGKHRRLRTAEYTDPLSMAFFPVFDEIDEPHSLVGLIFAGFYWVDFFLEVLSPRTSPIVAVLENSCGQVISFEIVGDSAQALGQGDLHDTKFNDWGTTLQMLDATDSDDDQAIMTYSGVGFNHDYCQYSVTLYPSEEMERFFITRKPFTFASLVVATLLFALLVFCMYDGIVEQRQRRVVKTADQTSAVVNSLFPDVVRDRLFKRNEMKKLNVSGQETASSAPIADLFPNATVMFADLAGFTAWSSLRDPHQVFSLLEAIFGSFDAIARKRKVFKIETIGDCYVAATGLPQPQPNHAVIMAKFAQECLMNVNKLTRDLEAKLGPDTGDLKIRIGIHSGPVTAGVLRGEKSRFQLFGDTVNMASRMESNGRPHQIHLSEATAELLIRAGKGDWVTLREDRVHAKGKGELQTYWLQAGSISSPLETSEHGNRLSSNASDESPIHMRDSNTSQNNRYTHDTGNRPEGLKRSSKLDKDRQRRRLVDWYLDILTALLQDIDTSRTNEKATLDVVVNSVAERLIPYEELVESIEMPSFDRSIRMSASDMKASVLNPAIITELKDYIEMIAQMYGDNPFHNFHHSIHVSMSATKLLKRVEAAYHPLDTRRNSRILDGNLHKLTFGLSSDPLAHFAIVFSTMVHDVDHSGVPNSQLVKEDDARAKLYKNRSIAEQNSIDLAWDLLMEPSYRELRQAIFRTKAEYERFRKLVVNSIMATDLFEPDLTTIRNRRWEQAFNNDSRESIQSSFICDLRATLVIELIIQASDISHTMQHWHVYQKWNKKLFNEMSIAYESGRAEKDPSEYWFQGELSFFDSYVIPIAKKLKECGVFGVSSDEYLDYAIQNRREWELKGTDLVQMWVAKRSSSQYIPDEETTPDLASPCKSDSSYSFNQDEKKMTNQCSWSTLINLSLLHDSDATGSLKEFGNLSIGKENNATALSYQSMTTEDDTEPQLAVDNQQNSNELVDQILSLETIDEADSSGS